MNNRSLIMTICVLALGIGVAGPALAKHPVKDIPVKFVRLTPEYGWTTTESIERQIEFANRVYANAGIKFTFDPASVFIDVQDDDLNCWFDDVQDDEATATWHADTNPESVTTIIHYRMSQAPGKACVTADCLWDFNCCPDDWNTTEWKCEHSVACVDYPNWPAAPLGFCGPTSLQGPGTSCFGSNCSVTTCDITTGWKFMRFVPMTNNPAIYYFAHEVGHHFGLAHAFDAPTERCYDQSEGTVPADCNSGTPWPATPFACQGGYYDCPNTTPYRNIMTYYTDCNARYAGPQGPSGAGNWNASLSTDQIAIIWRSLDEYYDRDVMYYQDWRDSEYGGWERMQVALSTGSREYKNQDQWSGTLFLPTGDSGWTKGNVRITSGDFNGDGRMDALVYTPTGSHPGLTLWLRSPLGNLTYTQAIVGSSWGSAVVTVGNVTGDMADDAVVQLSGLGLVFKGGVGGTSLTYEAYAPWPYTTHRVVVGNFGGKYELPAPMPSGLGYHLEYRTQQDATGSPPRWNNIAHDDMAVLGPSLFELYLGGSQLDLSIPSTSTGAVIVTGAWAGNVSGDYHDELLVRSSNNVTTYPGQDNFNFSTTNGYAYVGMTDPVLLSLGDFTGDHHADFLLTSPPFGTYLYRGAPDMQQVTAWHRTDLTPSNARHVVADFTRGGRDDVMFYTTSGSWLYAGKPAPTYFASNVWWDTSLKYPNVEWFGRQ